MKEKTRELIYSPDICEYNRNVILKYFELGLCTNSNKESCIITICDFLKNKADLPFNVWDEILVDSFFENRDWQIGYFDLIKNVLSDLLEISNCRITARNKSYFEELSKQDKYLYDFDMLQKHVQGTVGQLEFNITHGEKIVTSYSNVIVAIYLSWIGLRLEEIIDLCKNNVSLETRTIVYKNKVISFSNCKQLYNYLSYFIPATEQVIYRNNVIQTCRLIESDSLLKQGRAGAGVGRTTLSNKVTKLTGINLKSYYNYGLLNRLYLYEINGGIIDRKFASEIGEVLYISLSENIYGGKDRYYNLIREYSEYKKKRDKRFVGGE